MRAASVLPLLALAGLLLSGCAALTGEDTSSSSSLFGVCPQWIPGPGTASFHFAVQAHDTVYSRAVAPGTLRLDGRPLDMVQAIASNLTVTNGALALRVYADANGTRGPQLGITTYRTDPPSYVPVLPFAKASDTDRELRVYLSAADAVAPQPTYVWFGVTNESNATGALDVQATFHYRVCGK